MRYKSNACSFLYAKCKNYCRKPPVEQDFGWRQARHRSRWGSCAPGEICRQSEGAMSDLVSAVEATGTLKRTGVRWKIFLLMLFLVSVNYIDRASLSVAMPLISKEFNIDPALQGLILSSFFWTYAVMQVPGGML